MMTAARKTCQIGAARARQELHDGGLVAEGRVVHRAVAVLVLDLHLGGRPQQNPDHLRTQTKQPLRWLSSCHVQPRASGCGKGFVECFLNFPPTVGPILQLPCCPSNKWLARETQQKDSKNFFHNMMPQNVMNTQNTGSHKTTVSRF